MQSTTTSLVLSPLVIPSGHQLTVENYQTYPSGPGRTLHEIYTSGGIFLQRHANRMAHRLGLGPGAATHRIENFFGDGVERESNLSELAFTPCSELRRDCLRLMECALPCVFLPERHDYHNNIHTVSAAPNPPKLSSMHSRASLH
jgi:hypothetical protein